MRALFSVVSFAFIAMLVSFGISGQAAAQSGDPAITATRVSGEVTAIDVAAKQMILKTDAGSVVTIALSDATSYMRLPPGETTLTKATKITVADIGQGDRVLASGKVADDHKSATARSLVVMTKSDITKKQDQERAEWRRRGILGVISVIKPDTKEITISTRTLAGSQPVIIPVSDKIEMRRYAPDSIKFSDARPSGFEELKVGDQLRALGEKSADGTHFTPERVVTGAFQTVGGVVTAIDPATGEIKINDLEKKKPLTIIIKPDSVLRKFPSMAEMGPLMGGGRGPGAGGAPPAGGQPQGGAAPAQQPGGARPAGAGGPGGRGGFNIQDILERLPLIKITDVKVGDTIIVSSTKGADPTRLTAIAVVSGADTLLTMMAPRPAAGGGGAPNAAGGLGGSGITFGIGLP
jgi:hypothetical protein